MDGKVGYTESCIICLNGEFDTSVEYIMLGCNHGFCEDCIRVWFERKMTCPVCRVKVNDDCLTQEPSLEAVSGLIESLITQSSIQNVLLYGVYTNQTTRITVNSDTMHIRLGISNRVHPDNDDPEHDWT